MPLGAATLRNAMPNRTHRPRLCALRRRRARPQNHRRHTSLTLVGAQRIALAARTTRKHMACFTRIDAHLQVLISISSANSVRIRAMCPDVEQRSSTSPNGERAYCDRQRPILQLVARCTMREPSTAFDSEASLRRATFPTAHSLEGRGRGSGGSRHGPWVTARARGASFEREVCGPTCTSARSSGLSPPPMAQASPMPSGFVRTRGPPAAWLSHSTIRAARTASYGWRDRPRGGTWRTLFPNGRIGVSLVGALPARRRRGTPRP